MFCELEYLVFQYRQSYILNFYFISSFFGKQSASPIFRNQPSYREKNSEIRNSALLIRLFGHAFLRIYTFDMLSKTI